uniref:Uncharacterized protein n=1 Tax=Opuntia streptacantha TaxID=393608 RepID=A0A7C8ZP54_OPUST
MNNFPAHGATQPTRSSATTTTITSRSPATSASPAAATGLTAALFATFPSEAPPARQPSASALPPSGPPGLSPRHYLNPYPPPWCSVRRMVVVGEGLVPC